MKNQMNLLSRFTLVKLLIEHDRTLRLLLLCDSSSTIRFVNWSLSISSGSVNCSPSVGQTSMSANVLLHNGQVFAILILNFFKKYCVVYRVFFLNPINWIAFGFNFSKKYSKYIKNTEAYAWLFCSNYIMQWSWIYKKNQNHTFYIVSQLYVKHLVNFFFCNWKFTFKIDELKETFQVLIVLYMAFAGFFDNFFFFFLLLFFYSYCNCDFCSAVQTYWW